MVEHIQLILDVSHRPPLDAVCAQVVNPAVLGLNSVSMVESARTELALGNSIYSKTWQDIPDKGIG